MNDFEDAMKVSTKLSNQFSAQLAPFNPRIRRMVVGELLARLLFSYAETDRHTVLKEIVEAMNQTVLNPSYVNSLHDGTVQ